MTVKIKDIVKPAAIAADLTRALDREVDVEAMSFDELAKHRLLLDNLKKLVESRRKAITARIEAMVAAEPRQAEARVFYMKAPGYQDSFDVAVTFGRLRAAGAQTEQVFDAMSFKAASVNALCEVFQVDLGDARERKFKKQALGIRKV